MVKEKNSTKDPHPGRIKKGIQSRVKILYGVFALLSLMVIGQIVATQWGPNGTPLRNLSEERCYTTRTVEGSMGNIYDRNGEVLSTDTRGYRLRLDLHAEALGGGVWERDLPALCDSLSAMFGKPASHYHKLLSETRHRAVNKLGKSPYNQPFIPGTLNQREYDRLRSFPLMQPRYGLVVETRPIRHKVYGSLAAYTISSGIERAYNDVIEATDGENRFVWLDSRHRHSVPIIDKSNKPATSGSNIITTIDIDLQDVVEGALRKKLEDNNATSGTAVVVECATGEIRAMANLTHHEGGEMNDDFNYAIQWQGSPGSTFKGVSLMALVDEAGMSINKRIDCGTKPSMTINGLNITDTHVVGNKTGKTTLKGIFVESSNIGFAKTVTEEYSENPERWVEYINAIGIDKVRDIQRIKGYGFRGIKHPSSYKQHGGWSRTTLPQTAYGYEMEMTPMQTLMFYNAVANGGKLLQPILVKEIEKDGEVIESFSSEIINPAICSPESLAKVRECMEAVVSDEHGTGKLLASLPFDVAGKTGTAQVYQTAATKGKNAYETKDGGREYLATFVGYFPADNPKYTCIVSIKTLRKKGEVKFYTGAGVSLPVFKEIAEYIYAHDPEWRTDATKGIAAAPIAKPKSAPKVEMNVMPDVRGMGLRDALRELESRGLKVSFKGKGAVVSQSIEAGETITAGEEVRIGLEIQNSEFKIKN